jgi:hypothetical protein
LKEDKQCYIFNEYSDIDYSFLNVSENFKTYNILINE